MNKKGQKQFTITDFVGADDELSVELFEKARSQKSIPDSIRYIVKSEYNIKEKICASVMLGRIIEENERVSEVKSLLEEMFGGEE